MGEGQSLAITGSNGSGKSTLMRLIAGVLTPTSGSVELTLGGVEIPDETRSLHMGFVAPYLQLYDGLTLRENLRFVTRVRGRSQDDARLEEAIETVGLEGRGDDLISTYSSGMTQRARFAISLVIDPEILLLDEPSSNLDETGIAVVRDIFDRRVSRGKSIIVATNSREEKSWCAASLSVESFRRNR
jgi:heme exporter protein A